MEEKKLEQIKSLYTQAGYPALSKFKYILKKSGIEIQDTDVRKFLSTQTVDQLHKQTTRKHNIPIVVGTNYYTYQIDLLDMSTFSQANKGNNWIFICIDLFSKRASAIPQKKKTPQDSLASLKQAIKELGPQKPQIIHSDDGREWLNEFEKYLSENNIVRRINRVGDHNRLGVIDRFGKTIKNKLYRHFTATNKTVWLDIISSIVKIYNDTQHNSLCDMSPNEAKVFGTDTRICYVDKVKQSDKKYKTFATLRIGDTVRTKLKRTRGFTRGFDRIWSLNTFKIVEKNKFVYKLSNGEIFRENDLLKVVQEETKEKEEETVKEKNETVKEKEKNAVEEARKNKRVKNELKRENLKTENIIPERTKRERKPTEFFGKK